MLGLLGAVVAGLAFDSGSAPREDEHEPQDTPEGEAWGVSAAFLGFGEDDAGTDHGGTEPDGQPISNDTPTPTDPDRDMTGTAGADQMTGGSGQDHLTASAGDDHLDGRAGNDTLWGAAPGAADTDVDILNGGEGDDILHLGAGDYGHGGAGADSFTLQDFGPGAPLMQITDFDPAEDDLVVIYDSALHPDPQLSLTEGNGATLLLLDGVPLASLTAGANIDLAAIRLQAA
jgi:Ca2+-binding RTX toxin-like protein